MYWVPFLLLRILSSLLAPHFLPSLMGHSQGENIHNISILEKPSQNSISLSAPAHSQEKCWQELSMLNVYFCPLLFLSIQHSSAWVSLVLMMPPIFWSVPCHHNFVKPQSLQESAKILSIPQLYSPVDSNEKPHYRAEDLSSWIAIQGPSDISS